MSKNDFEVDVAHSSKDALPLLKQNFYEVILCDYRLPKITGTEMLEKIKEIHPSTAVIIITGYSDVRTAVSILKKGAFDYVTKPLFPDEILMTINRAIKQKENAPTASQVTSQINTLEKAKKKVFNRKVFVKGKSKQAETVQKHVDLIAPTDMSVIILGETGTGKEFVANAIHQKSKRAGHPFVAIDCGALPKDLAGSELFGHLKGSFTGALTDKKGSFEIANGGTLFLDEIGNLSYDNQIKLLRVLQERKIKPIGGNKDIEIDVRIITATNEDLKVAARKSNFREDLYHRLNEFKIELAPLRERRTDIMLFAEHFLALANEELDKEVGEFTPEAKHILREYYWHGNLRELGNVVKRAVLLAQGDQVTTECLPQEIINPEYIIVTDEQEAEGKDLTDLKEVAEQAERKAILQVLEKTGYNKTKTAKVLNIDRKTLYNKLKAFGIDI